MTVNEVLSFLDTRYPLNLAAEFDNVGLLIGNGSNEVSSAIVCLDCTTEVIDKAIATGANLIITHHPVVFNPIRSLTSTSIAYLLARHDISVISMHTNLDSAENGVNDTLCNIIGLDKVSSLVCGDLVIRIGSLPSPMPAKQFAELVSKKLGGFVRYSDSGKPVCKIGVCSGSGADLIGDALNAGADAFLTAEIKHHQFIDAKNQGYCLFDAGHFRTENIIVPELVRVLSAEFGNMFIAHIDSPVFETFVSI